MNQKVLIKRSGGEGGEDGVIDNPTAIREFCLSKSDRVRAELASEREEATARKKKKELDKSQQIMRELNSPGSTAKAKSRTNDDSSDEDDYNPTAKKSKAATTSKKTTVKSRKNVYEDSDDDDFVEDSPSLKKRAPAKAKAATTSTSPSSKADS